MVRPREAGFGWAAPVVTGVLIVAAWHFGVRLSGVPESFLPSPGAVLTTLLEERAVLWESTLTTLTETLSGVLLAVASALVWALVLDRSTPTCAVGRPESVPRSPMRKARRDP